MEKFRSRRYRVAIEKQIVIPPLPWAVWTRVCETWAQLADDETITIRYQPNLFPGMRVSVGRKHFEILGIIDRPGKTRLVELKIRAEADAPSAQR
jgi:hypothetical protein